MSNRQSDASTVTMEDVEMALKILNNFIQTYQRSQQTIARLQKLTGRSSAGGIGNISKPEDIMKMLVQNTTAGRALGKYDDGSGADEPEPTLTPEEIAKFKAIGEKVKEKERKPSAGQ